MGIPVLIAGREEASRFWKEANLPQDWALVPQAPECGENGLSYLQPACSMKGSE